MKGLLANNYTLTVTLEASDTANYYTLTREITFRVTVANNSWTTTPGMTGWQYSNFAANVNFIAGEPAGKSDDAGVEVTYALFDMTPTLAAFKALTSGTFTDIAEVADELKAKARGNYYIAAYYPAVEGKYEELFAFVSFAVAQATTNVWSAHANVSGWTYGAAASQVVAGIATFGSDTATYTLDKQDKVNNYTNVAQDSTITALNSSLVNLGAGLYRLTVKIEGTDNYVGTTDTLYFTVAKANNAWTTAPSMSDYDWVYGEAAGTVTIGEVAYTDGVNEDGEDNITVVMAFYAARQINGAWTVDYAKSFDNMPTNIGHYALVVTANGTDNYNELKEELFFNVTMFANSWTTNPENSLIWTWGNTSVMENSVLVSATAVKADVVTYTINYASNGNAYKSNIAQANIIAELKALPVGSYVITVTSAEDVVTSNYSSVSSSCDITVNSATLVWATAPANAGWTWGDADADRTFVQPAATAVKSSDVVSYKFAVSKQNAEGKFVAEATYNSYGELTDVILAAGYAAGNYKIVVSATCDNHDDLDREVTLTIAARSFTWVTDPVNASWAWGDRAAEAAKIVEPQVTDKNGAVALKYVLTYGTATETFADTDTKTAFEALIARLAQDDIDASRTVYTVSVTAEQNNYATSVKTFTVIVSESENYWTATPTTTINKEYQSDITADKLVIASAKDGTVIYSIGGETVDQTTLLTTINNLPVGTYTYKINVAGVANRYTELNATLTVKVSGKGSTWGMDFETSYETTYSANLSTFMQNDVVNNLPTKTDGKLTYAVEYIPYFGSEGNPTINSLTDLTTYLTSTNRNAGVYKIKIHYQPNDEGYSPLDAEITVTVGRVDVTLTNQSEYVNSAWEYEDTYQAVTVPDPTLSVNRIITYSVTDVNGKDYPLAQGQKLSELLNTLNVGQYTIKFSAAEDANYTGVREQEIRLRINPAINSWVEGTKFEDVTMNRGDEFAITVPQALRGTTRVVYHGTPLDLTGTTLNDYLNGLANDDQFVQAGSHRIEFIVDSTSNYNGVSGFYTITIVKKANNWTSSLADATWRYSEAPESITEPVAANGTIVYKITGTQLNGDAYSQEYTLFEKFEYAVLTLNAGTYTISASITETTDYVGASCSATITVRQFVTAWDYDGKNMYSWIYGDGNNESIKAINVNTEAVSIEFSVVLPNGTTHVLIDDKTTTENEADYNVYLKKQGIGTYIIQATVVNKGENKNDIGLNYSSLSMQITVTISAADNAWENGKAPVNLEFVYGNAPASVVYEAKNNNDDLYVSIDGEEVTVSGLTAKIANLEAGTHTLIATVPEKGNYKALTSTVTITVSKQTEIWSDSSLGVGVIDNNTYTNKWTWNTSYGQGNWSNPVLPVPSYANKATVTITSDDTTFNTIRITVIYEKNVDGKKVIREADMQLLISRMKTLNAGDYVITVTVEETSNYSEITKSIAFTVNKAENSWNDKPAVENWNYNGTIMYPTAVPTFGKANDVVFYYATYSESDNVDLTHLEKHTEFLAGLIWTTDRPTEKGTYYLKGELAGTANYSDLVGYNYFTIGADNNEWIDAASVIAWNWNGYDITKNLFGGSAHAGNAKFTIRKMVDGEPVALTIDDFIAWDKTTRVFSKITAADFNLINNGFGRVLDENNKQTKFVSEEVAKVLNWLLPGNYQLTVVISGDPNYETRTATVNFSIGKSANGWTNVPGIVSYTYGDYNATTTLTAGAATYGNVLYSITGSNGFAIGTSGYSLSDIIKELAKLSAGNYTLNVWVQADANYDTYATVAARSVHFEVLKTANAWTNNTNRDSQISKDWTDIQALTNLNTMYPAYGATDGTVKYAILNEDYSYSVYKQAGQPDKELSGLSYADLLTYLKKLSLGQYYIRATVDATTNYTGLSPLDTALVITSRTNSFNADNDEHFTAQWKQIRDEQGNLVNASELQKIKFGAEYGGETITYTLQNVTLPVEYRGRLNEANFALAVKTLNAGSYNVLVEIDETNDYAGLSAVVMLNVGAGTNSWQNVDENTPWDIEKSLKVSGNVALTWTWKSVVEWLNARPVYGNTVYVEIRANGATNASHYITVDYAVGNGTTAIGNVCTALSGLDYGTYTITVTAPATQNWQELKEKVEFVVTTAENKWTTIPNVSGADVTGSDYSYTWVYGTKVTLNYEALYGNEEIAVTYLMADGKTPLSAMPATVGKYILRFTVADPDSKNYKALSQDVNVQITKATLSSFAEGVSVVGWTWNGFNRITNRFVAVPDSQGEVRFTVLDENKNVAKVSGTILDKDGNVIVINNKELANITLENVDGRLVVSDTWAKLLNLLTAGTYTLKVDVGETDNHIAFSEERTTFAVSEATNTWTVTPSVAPWSLNAFDKKVNTPVAEARYGRYEIFIKADINDEVFYHEYFDEVTGKYVAVNNLNSAPIGWYTMTAIVKKADGRYNNGEGKDLTGSMRFQIFVKGSPDIDNHWVDIPSISGWTANLDGEFNMPVGTPARGRAYFEFYKAVKNANGEYVRGDKVTADDLVITIPNTDNIYAKEWYIPIAPGWYFMAACAEVSGNPDDGLETFLLQPFEISKRTNAFIEEPRIETLLYLGDRANWAEPTALVIDGNDKIVYTYVNKITGEKLGTAKPSKEGTYYLIATVEETTFYKAIESKPVEFTVKLSTNAWEVEPIIEDWTEELLEKDPEALAKYGGEVTYTYENLATGDISYVKPTTEGSYKMTATVKLAGYEDLVGTTTFTIDPAYDTDLLIVDIVLGLIGCALAIFVIIFAIRRYREN